MKVAGALNVTLIYPYYDNAGMLARHLAEWQSYPVSLKAQLKFIIVDDGSPNIPAVDVIRKTSVPDAGEDLDIQLYRIKPNIPWNQDGARNLGMRYCKTSWALMTDMDHLLEPDQAAALVNAAPLPGNYYMPVRKKRDGSDHHAHPNTFLFNHSDFWAMGGYDEDFAGAYGSDENFRKCAKGAGLIERQLSLFYLTLYSAFDIEDANTKDWGRTESGYYIPHHPQLEAKARGPAYRATNPLRFEYIREL